MELETSHNRFCLNRHSIFAVVLLKLHFGVFSATKLRARREYRRRGAGNSHIAKPIEHQASQNEPLRAVQGPNLLFVKVQHGAAAGRKLPREASQASQDGLSRSAT